MPFSTTSETVALTNQEEKEEKARLEKEYAELLFKINEAKRYQSELVDVNAELSTKKIKLTELSDKLKLLTKEHEQKVGVVEQLNSTTQKKQQELDELSEKYKKQTEKLLESDAEVKKLQNAIKQSKKKAEEAELMAKEHSNLLGSVQITKSDFEKEISLLKDQIMVSKKELDNLFVENKDLNKKNLSVKKEIESSEQRLSDLNKKHASKNQELLYIAKTTDEIIYKAKKEAEKIVSDAYADIEKRTLQLNEREGNISLRESWVAQKEEAGRAAIADFEMKTHKKLNINFG